MSKEARKKNFWNNKSGFTLIELSIVLVIIGLIVGGVLVGQDLIHAAEIRATISQKDQFNVATNTFRLKYNYLPGDMPNSEAAAYGFYDTGFLDNGNGIIEGIDLGREPLLRCLVVDLGGESLINGEDRVFFRHLSDAKMISGNTNPDVGGNPVYTESVFPRAKLGDNFYFRACAAYGFNYFQILGITNMLGSPQPFLKSADAYNMDSKIDDGLPNSGQVKILPPGEDLALEPDFVISWSASAAAGNCLYGGASNEDEDAEYNINPSYAGMCQGIMFKFQ